MSCVMRADGSSFDVDAFCLSTSLPVIAKHRAGERRRPGSSPSPRSSINVSVSDADFDSLPQQVEDAVGFLERQAQEVRRLVGFPGVEGVTLDLWLEASRCAGSDRLLPAKLVSLAGALGVGITVSQYEIAPA